MGPVAATLVAEGIKGLFSLFGSHAQTSASDKALAASTKASSAALEYEKEQARAAEAARVEQANYDRQYQAGRDSRADAASDVTRANRAPYVAAGQGAITTLGELVTPGHRVNGATGMVTTPDGVQSIGDLVKARAAVTPLPTTAPPAPPTPITPPRTSASDGAPDGFLKNSAGGLDPGGAFHSVPGMPGAYYGADGYTVMNAPKANTVTVKMPNGQMGDVPSGRVGELVAQGGIVIKNNQSAAFMPRYGR